MNRVLEKELHVAMHAQTWRFRFWKYLAFAVIFGGVYWWKGGEALLWALGISFACAIAVHLFYRYMTNGWQDSWGGYQSLFK